MSICLFVSFAGWVFFGLFLPTDVTRYYVILFILSIGIDKRCFMGYHDI